MNILITGAKNWSYWVIIYRTTFEFKEIKNVYLIDNARTNNLNVLFNFNFKNVKIKFIHGDLLGLQTLKIRLPISVVVHLASITNAEDSFKIKKFVYLNNYGIFKNIVKLHFKKSKLVHLSSTSIYD